MFAIFTYLLFLFSYSYQLLIFYKLNQYRLGSIKDILKIIIILVISIIILDFIIGQAIFLILVIFFYSKKSQLSKIVSTILFANLITYAADLFIRLIGLSFPIITSYFVPIAVTYYVLVYFLIKRVKLYQLFIKEKNYLLLGLIVYAFIALHIIGLISMKANQDLTGILITALLLFIQLLFMIDAFYIQNKLFDRRLEDRLNKERENNLKSYLKNLEYSEEKLRRFKHDYRNMLISLRNAIKEDDNDILINKLDRYSENELDQENFEEYKDLIRVKDLQVKSILISKINEIDRNNIKFSFECATKIDNLDKLVNPFDLSRIIGIAFDNAIEESKNNQIGEINAYIFQNGKTFTFEIRNKIKNIPQLSKIQQTGFSTKKNHQGLGLSNINQLKQKYPTLFVNYRINNNWFIFTLNIVGVDE